MAYIIMATKAETVDGSTWEISCGGFRRWRSVNYEKTQEKEFRQVFPGFKMDENTGEMTLLYKKESADGANRSIPPITKIQQIVDYLRGQLGDRGKIATSHATSQATGEIIFTWTIA